MMLSMLKAKVLDIRQEAVPRGSAGTASMDPRIEAEMKRAAEPIPGSVQDEESRRKMPARSAAEARLEEMEGFIPSSDTSA